MIQVRNTSSSAAPLAAAPRSLSHQKHLSLCKWVQYKSASNVLFHDETEFCKETGKAASPCKCWDGLSHIHQLGWEQGLGEEGGEKERDLGSVMIINDPFSRSQLCLRTTSPVGFMLQNDYHIINRPGWILALWSRGLKKTLMGWGRKDVWRGGQHRDYHQKCTCRGFAHKDGNESVLRAAEDELVRASTSREGKVCL